ncbi:MAG: prenyltransferase, partial [Gemmataceae bacterium]
DRAVRLIVRSQNTKGGWRYHPHSTDADLSVTICQIMALRSAKNAGFYVPKAVADRCIAYVKRCRDPRGGFRYMDSHGGPAFARTAAGVVALYSAGLYNGPEVEDGLRYLMNCKPGNHFLRHDMHYFYGHYYAAQAMWTAGGKYWQEWYPAIRDDLLNSPRLRPEGSWFDPICTHYGTAMACIILQIPNNYLPILQK